MEAPMNIGAKLYGKDDLRIEEIPPAGEPGDHEVLLKISKVSICGTDVSWLKRGFLGNHVLKKPMVLGHESAGVVIKCGSKVKNLKLGDRVAVEPGVPCRMCEYCKGGRYNLCPDVIYCADPPKDGALCRYFKHAADFCFKLPDHVSLEEGAMMQPLGIAVYACRRANITFGKTVLICGAGPIGLLILLAAKAMGATNVCITDIREGPLNLAKKFGANHTLLTLSKDSKDLANKISTLMGCMPDITIECSGAEPSIRLGIHSTKSGGTMVLVGLGAPESKIPIVDAAMREIDIRGIFHIYNSYPLALEMVASGKIDLKPLITHRFTLGEALKAFETARSAADGVIKVMIDCDN